MVNSNAECCKESRVAPPLYWIGKQILEESGGTVASLARKVVKATCVPADTSTSADQQEFQALKMRIMARRAKCNALRLKSKDGRRKSAEHTASAEENQNTENHGHSKNTESVKSSAAETIAKSRAMLARLKNNMNQIKSSRN